MRKWLLVIVGLVVFSVSLLAHMPAQLLVPARQGKFQFLGTGGTLWRGEIQQIRHAGKVLPIRNLHWTVRPSALLTGALEADVYEEQTPTNRGTMRLNLLSREFELRGLHWQLREGSLDAWFRKGVSLKGLFMLDLQRLQLAENTLLPSRLQGRLDWQNAELQFDAYDWTIGSPVVQFSDEGQTIEGTLTNSQPLLPGDGTIQCVTELCQVALSLRPAPGAPQALLNGLMLMGLQQSGNTFSGQMTIPLKRPGSE